MCNTVVDRSINTAPVKRILSNAVPQFSMSSSKTWMALQPLLQADINSDKKLSAWL